MQASLPTLQVLVRFHQTFLGLVLQQPVQEDHQHLLHLALVDQ
ncbi:hypothetical protein H323_12595 [Vibrio parahaemolyticus VP766]|nr:hypothetical protein H323_12595 [Vibrio parahaemolyticus VP766]